MCVDFASVIVSLYRAMSKCKELVAAKQRTSVSELTHTHSCYPLLGQALVTSVKGVLKTSGDKGGDVY